MADDFTVGGIPLTPDDDPGLEAPPPPLGPPRENVCDVCGSVFKNEHGVSMHKARAHRGKNWSPRKRTTKQPPAEKPEYTKVTLREVWTSKDGRMLLLDQDGAWWGAKKLDF